MTPPLAYDEHARRMNDLARTEYFRWLASMSPTDRRRVQEMGLDRPPRDDSEVAGHPPCVTLTRKGLHQWHKRPACGPPN